MMKIYFFGSMIVSALMPWMVLSIVVGIMTADWCAVVFASLAIVSGVYSLSMHYRHIKWLYSEMKELRRDLVEALQLNSETYEIWDSLSRVEKQDSEEAD